MIWIGGLDYGRTKKNERFFSYSRHISYWGIGDFVPLHSVRYVSYASLHLLFLEALDTFQFYMCAEEHHLIIKYGQFVLVFEWNPDDFVELRGQILRLLLNFWFVWKVKDHGMISGFSCKALYRPPTQVCCFCTTLMEYSIRSWKSQL